MLITITCKVDDPITIAQITCYIVGVHPFGLSTLIVGFDPYSSASSLYFPPSLFGLMPTLARPHYTKQTPQTHRTLGRRL